MCGIAGIASARSAVDVELVSRMCDALAHRGPDDEGLWRAADGTVVLGHRRLAIIDLSPGGHQPMTDRAGRSRVVFNGEMYNYQDVRAELCRRGRQFRSASDTEVLLEAYAEWGTDCLDHLNGMFAFALYDEPRRTLFVARDRAGEKPLFYRHDEGRLAFASELKGLLADGSCPRTIDREALECYLAFGYVPFDRCILRGFRKLPQGHALTYDVAADSLRTWRYWSLPEPDANERLSPSEQVDELERLLLDSVRLRLIADVPIGVLLSGGIDSSLVTAMAARVSRRVKTFTISFPGHGSYDEGPYARAVAEHFDTDHVELAAEPATVDLLPELARQYDEPIADSSMVPTYLVSRLIRKEATVALGGDGGDELFGGYPYYSWLQSQDRIRAVMPNAFRRAMQPIARRVLPVGMRGRNYALGTLTDVDMSVGQFNIYIDAETRSRLLSRRGAVDLRPELYKAGLCKPSRTILQQATAVDFQSYLVDDILVKVDRASMLCSLEVRAPFLDPRIIELAFRRAPDTLRATLTERKVLPRRLAERLLPSSLDLRRKQGFSLPLQTWFKGDWGRYIRQVLTEADPALFNQNVIQTLLDRQDRGYANTHRLFQLAIFELWRREYRVAIG